MFLLYSWCYELFQFSSIQFSSVAQSCPTLCDPMSCSTPGLSVHPQLPKFTQTPICSWQIDGETMESVTDFILGGAPKSLQMVTAAMKLKDACSLEKSYEKHRQHIKMQRHYFADKGPSSQSYGFSSIYVWMWELDHKERWAPKNWCFWTVVLKKTLESPLDCQEIQPVHPKGNQNWC